MDPNISNTLFNDFLLSEINWRETEKYLNLLLSIMVACFFNVNKVEGALRITYKL